MKQVLLYTAIVLNSINGVVAQTLSIQWGPEVIVHDQPVLNQDNDGAEVGRTVRFRRAYGSEYGRMLKLSNDKWLVAYTVSRNDGYQKDQNGGYELEIAESTDGGKKWKIIALITDKGRDLDNAQLIQLADKSILLSCRSVRWQESYRLPVYRSDDNGNTWKKISVIDANEGKPGELGKPDKGVYEPHLGFLPDGRLAVMYASEKHVQTASLLARLLLRRFRKILERTGGLKYG